MMLPAKTSSEHTQYSVSQICDGFTGSQSFWDVDEALAHARKLLISAPCGKLSIDKYTPTTDELHDWDELSKPEQWTERRGR